MNMAFGTNDIAVEVIEERSIWRNKFKRHAYKY